MEIKLLMLQAQEDDKVFLVERADNLKKQVRLWLAQKTKALKDFSIDKSILEYFKGHRYTNDIISDVVSAPVRKADFQKQYDLVSAFYKETFGEDYVFNEDDLNNHYGKNQDNYNMKCR